MKNEYQRKAEKLSKAVGAKEIDRHCTGHLDRSEMAESLFVDTHASYYRRHPWLFECLVLDYVRAKEAIDFQINNFIVLSVVDV